MKNGDGACARPVPTMEAGESETIDMYTLTKTYPARSLRILVVEDNFFNQKVAVGMLQKMGHAVTVANNGREAVTTSEAPGFDLIFMDSQMPEMDGFQATAAIRRRQR